MNGPTITNNIKKLKKLLVHLYIGATVSATQHVCNTLSSHIFQWYFYQFIAFGAPVERETEKMPSFIENIFCCQIFVHLSFRQRPTKLTNTTLHRIDATRREWEQNMKMKNLWKSWSSRRMHIWKAYNIQCWAADIVVDLFCLRHMCALFSLQNFITKSLFCILCRWAYV